jgi:hypothetical protein
MTDSKITVDTTQLKAFSAMWLKDAPKQARYAVARVLTLVAVQTRKEAIGVIEKKMNVRNRAFVRSRVVYRKANANEPVTQQASWVGSQQTDRFTGWIEQQLGSPTEQKHRHGTNARPGTTGKVSSKKRLKPSTKIMKPDSDPRFVSALARVKNRKPWHAGALMLRIAQRLKMGNRMYMVPEGDRAISEGIYWMTGSGKLQWISTINQAENTKRLPWMDWAREKALASMDIGREWQQAMVYQLERRYRRRK